LLSRINSGEARAFFAESLGARHRRLFSTVVEAEVDEVCASFRRQPVVDDPSIGVS
jgi:hypothetical protein